jgi:hypothetical protein
MHDITIQITLTNGQFYDNINIAEATVSGKNKNQGTTYEISTQQLRSALTLVQ